VFSYRQARLCRTNLKVSQFGLGGFLATWPEKLTERDSLTLMLLAIYDNLGTLAGESS
jgi:aryl-alcohol dehydrogenase-like predicted oxidoreductase